jgi:hypothetical protein
MNVEDLLAEEPEEQVVEPDSPEQKLKEDLIRMVRRANALHSRSMQTAIGPSQVGNPCDRSLGYQIRDREGEPISQCEPDSSDPIPAIVGTATHAWLEQAAAQDNLIERTMSGMDKWKPEVTLNIKTEAYELTGSCDIFDNDTGTVIDWKVVGQTSYRKYQRDELPAQYRIQAQLYGLGYEQLGYNVERVAIAVLPRNGPLRDLLVISMPFDRALAEASLVRLSLIEQANDWQAQTPNPSSDHCRWCAVPSALCKEKEY